MVVTRAGDDRHERCRLVKNNGAAGNVRNNGAAVEADEPPAWSMLVTTGPATIDTGAAVEADEPGPGRSTRPRAHHGAGDDRHGDVLTRAGDTGAVDARHQGAGDDRHGRGGS